MQWQILGEYERGCPTHKAKAQGSGRIGGCGMRSHRKGRGWRDVVGKINGVLKSSKVISKGLHAFGNPYGLGTAAMKLGYGRRKGSGWRDVLGKINDVLKSSKVISKGLTAFGNPYGLKTAAINLVYGRHPRHCGAKRLGRKN